MSYVWEEELMPLGDGATWKVLHHLKKCLPKNDGSPFHYKVTVAWVTKIGNRKWDCQFVNHNDGSRTFRSLKAAKAYAVAITTLENTNERI